AGTAAMLRTVPAVRAIAIASFFMQVPPFCSTYVWPTNRVGVCSGLNSISANVGVTIWRARNLLLVPDSMVPPVMPRIEGVRAVRVYRHMTTMVAAPAPVVDLFDRTGTVNCGTQSRRRAEGRSVSTIWRQRTGGERSYGDID